MTQKHNETKSPMSLPPLFFVRRCHAEKPHISNMMNPYFDRKNNGIFCYLNVRIVAVFFYISLFAGLLLGSVVSANDSHEVWLQKAKYRFTFDHTTLPGEEKMGLLGGNYLFSVDNGGYFGLGVYGAVSGERGGFFTGGLAFGWNKKIIGPLAIDAGVFLGGGGGGAAPQGGGFMLRPHLTALFSLGENALGFGVSRVEFPNGDISSHQYSLSFEHPFHSFFLPGWRELLDFGTQAFEVNQFDFGNVRRTRAFAFQALMYLPNDGQTGRSGRLMSDRVDVIGVRWRQYWLKNWWLEFETGGALGGKADGFAQVLGGVSYRKNIDRLLSLTATGLLGAAGGGDVDTGGGLIYRLMVGAAYHFTEEWTSGFEFGIVKAVDGDFFSKSVLLKISHEYQVLLPALGTAFNAEDTYLKAIWHKYRLRANTQHYLPVRKQIRKHDNLGKRMISLAGLKIDTFINQNLFLTGQALGAYAGEAGGYAAGLVGIGRWKRLDEHPTWTAQGQLLVGAAGGGGVSVGGGLILQPMVNISKAIMANAAIGIGLGAIYAPEGKLMALVGDLSIEYRYSVPHI